MTRAVYTSMKFYSVNYIKAENESTALSKANQWLKFPTPNQTGLPASVMREVKKAVQEALVCAPCKQ